MTATSVRSRVETITPKIAEAYLSQNTHNRPINNRAVEEYAASMKAGQWELNGEAIIFDTNDTLQDGQHRLWACVDSKKSFQTVVTTGVSPDSFATIDTGRKRSAADVLAIDGHKKHSRQLGAAANIAIRYRSDKLGGSGTVTHAEILKFCDKNADLQTWLDRAMSVKGWSKDFAAPIAAVMFLGSRKHPGEALAFLTKFQSGEDLKSGDPILALRNRLITDQTAGGGKRKDRLALIVMAWNAFVGKRKLAKMQLPRGGFPKIAGAQ